MSDNRAPDNNKAIFGKQNITTEDKHTDKPTASSKKESHMRLLMLKKLIEEQLYVEYHWRFDFSAEEANLFRGFVAKVKLKMFIE